MDYSPEVLRRFAAPSRVGRDDLPDAVTGSAEDRSLNVWVRFQVHVVRGRIEASRFNAYGCPHTVAAADWIAERLEGRSAEALWEVDLGAAARELDIPRPKLGKLLRIEDALKRCAAELGRRKSTKGSE